MNKSHSLVITVLFFLFFINGVNATQNMSCDNRGSFSLNTTSSPTGMFATFAANPDQHINITGTWKQTGDRAYQFNSDDLLFNAGEYFIYEDDATFMGLITCPGISFNCLVNTVHLDKCYYDDNLLRAWFNVSSLPQYKKTLDVYSDLLMGVYGSTYVREGISSKDTTILEEMRDYYLISVPLEFGTSISEVSLQIRDCGILKDGATPPNSSADIRPFLKYPQSMDFKRCESVPKCSSNEYCADDQFCNSNTDYCEPVKCTAGQRAYNHKCVSCIADYECNRGSNKVCSANKCINYACVAEPVVCRTDDECLTGSCVEPKGCEYAINESCMQNKILGGVQLENMQLIQFLDENQITQLLGRNEKLKNEMELVLGVNITPQYVKKIAMNVPELSRRTQLKRSIYSEGGRTILKLNVKYLGEGNAEKFVIYDEVPKEFAQNAEDMQIKANGGLIKIIEADPKIAFFYKLVKPMNEFDIEYSINKSLDVKILNSINEPIVLAETIIGYNPARQQLLYVGFALLVPIVVWTFVAALRKPKKILVRQRIGGLAAESGDVLGVENLSLKYNGKNILKKVSFSVKAATLYSIIGFSGSGKSTIIECIAGRKSFDEGSIEVLGKNMEIDKLEVCYAMGFVPQHAELNMDETVWKNMKNSAIKWSIESPDETICRMLERFNLDSKRDLPAKKLSGGQQKLLSLATELLRDPKVLLLDEPTTGLDPSTRSDIFTLLTKLVTVDGKTIIMTTHYMDEAEESDEVAIVNAGRIVISGSPDALRRKMPGEGKIISLKLGNLTEDLTSRISALPGVRGSMVDGKEIQLIADNPKLISFSKKIEEMGGRITESKIFDASMKEIFMYYKDKGGYNA